MPNAFEQASAESFESWMRARQDSMLRLAWVMTGDPHTAEDLVATTLAKVYLHWSRIQRLDNVDAYARRMLANEHTSLWRRAWRRRETSRDVLPDAGSAPTYDGGEGADVWRAVMALPQRQREVVALRFYEQLSTQETADALGISTGTVKSQTSKAMATLRTDPTLRALLEDL